MRQPTRQDSQTWKSEENISTLTKRTRTSDPCDACLLLSFVVFSCVGFPAQTSCEIYFVWGASPLQNLKRKQGWPLPPYFPRTGRKTDTAERASAPSFPDGQGKQPEKRGGPLPPIFRPRRKHQKSEEGLCPPFPERDNKRKSKHIIFMNPAYDGTPHNASTVWG